MGGQILHTLELTREPHRELRGVIPGLAVFLGLITASAGAYAPWNVRGMLLSALAWAKSHR